MKKMKGIFLPTAAAITLVISSCKDKESHNTAADSTVTTSRTDTAPAPATVQISADDSLTTQAKDAVKDYPGVDATVRDGEVTLTGSISRDRLPKLMQAVNATHPKKVNNQLTIKK